VKIPENAIIPDEKITRYLLVSKPRNDVDAVVAEHPQAIDALLFREEAFADFAADDGAAKSTPTRPLVSPPPDDW